LPADGTLSLKFLHLHTRFYLNSAGKIKQPQTVCCFYYRHTPFETCSSYAQGLHSAQIWRLSPSSVEANREGAVIV